MNWDSIQGNWKQFKGNVRERWGKLTDDDLDKINGRREQLAGRIQEAYGMGKEDVEKQLHDFEVGLDTKAGGFGQGRGTDTKAGKRF